LLPSSLVSETLSDVVTRPSLKQFLQSFVMINHELKQRGRRLIDWLGSHELSTLVAFVGLAAGLWAFAAIADEVLEGETESFDTRILLALRAADDPSDPLGPIWVEELARDITALGGIGILTFISAAVVVYLWLQAQPRASLFVLVAVLGALVIGHALKWHFARPRPDLVPHEAQVYTASFPSGHSTMSAATYLTLAALLARVHAQLRLKAYFLILAGLLTLAVGFSRVYLGVHWPTDVLAGWTLGASWAVLCWLIARWLQRRGEIEPEQASAPADG
jgi:undecaprenyl-diphosphatase